MVWNIVGGIYGSFVLGSYYIVPSILAVRGTGMDGVIKVPEWGERIEENPANKQRFLDFDSDEFLKLMLRWLNAFVSKPGQTIPGVDDEMFDRIKIPTLDHSRWRERPGSPQADIAGSQLLDQGIQADRPALAGGRVGTRVGSSRAGQSEALQHV